MTLDKQTPSEQIARFIERHPGEWQELPTDNCDEMTVVLDIYPYQIKLEAYHSTLGGSLENVNHDATPQYDAPPTNADLLTQIAYRGADAIQTHGGSVDGLPLWLVEPVRVELRRRANELLAIAGGPTDSTTSPEISPDSQAIEQARAVLKATNGISGEQALVVLEDLRRILGVTV